MVKIGSKNNKFSSQYQGAGEALLNTPLQSFESRITVEDRRPSLDPAI